MTELHCITSVRYAKGLEREGVRNEGDHEEEQHNKHDNDSEGTEGPSTELHLALGPLWRFDSLL